MRDWRSFNSCKEYWFFVSNRILFHRRLPSSILSLWPNSLPVPIDTPMWRHALWVRETESCQRTTQGFRQGFKPTLTIDTLSNHASHSGGVFFFLFFLFIFIPLHIPHFLFLFPSFPLFFQRTRTRSSSVMCILAPRELPHYSSLLSRTFTIDKVRCTFVPWITFFKTWLTFTLTRFSIIQLVD